MSAIKKVLVANRGEIALRVIRALREMGIDSVAVYSDADRGTLHVRAATEAVGIGPPAPAESYLRADRILEAAKATGADAIHPGYGFLSENANFAEQVEKAGIRWIGPGARAIREMGEKVAARTAMEAANVPVVPGCDEVKDVERLKKEAERIGFPLMIKASGGGGGKGIRIVHRADELVSNWERARSEAKTGFGNEAVYMEKYLAQARHIEIQVIADTHGNVVHLGERECSMQRRHQKVIEETPSMVVDETLRQQMGEAAVRAAQAVDYVNAGTVEFLVDDDGKFYFLEMNTRLQVEHPITEMVTGVDLVREQLRVAAGEPLSFTQQDVSMRGHAIEVRICSEEPEKGFVPSTGTVRSLDQAGGSQVRFDSAVYAGMEVSVYYDPMLAKLIVSGSDRPTAIRRMRRALQELRITGVATNISFLLALVDSQAFLDGDYHTMWIEQNLDSLVGPPPEEISQIQAVLAAVIHRELERHRTAQSTSNRARTSRWLESGRSRALQGWTP